MHSNPRLLGHRCPWKMYKKMYKNNGTTETKQSDRKSKNVKRVAPQCTKNKCVFAHSCTFPLEYVGKRSKTKKWEKTANRSTEIRF